MSRVSRAAAVLFVVVLALSAASVAFAKFSKGIYRTKPPPNRTKFLDLSFTATKTKAKQVRYSYRAPSACSSGSSAVGDEEDYLIPATAINQQTGKFSPIKITEPDGDKLTITGKIKGRQASGTFRSSFSAGPVTCDTGTLHWTALHLG